MAQVPPFHTDSPVVPPPLRFIYHDHDDCPLGMHIPLDDCPLGMHIPLEVRKPGVALRPHCKSCQGLG